MGEDESLLGNLIRTAREEGLIQTVNLSRLRRAKLEEGEIVDFAYFTEGCWYLSYVTMYKGETLVNLIMPHGVPVDPGMIEEYIVWKGDLG